MTGLLGFGVARVSAVWSGRIEQYVVDGVDNAVSRSDSQDACSEAVGVRRVQLTGDGAGTDPGQAHPEMAIGLRAGRLQVK